MSSVKPFYLDKRVTKKPTIDGSLANLQNFLNLKSYVQDVVDSSDSLFTTINVDTIDESTAGHGVVVKGITVKNTTLTLADTLNVVLSGTTGTKIGTSTSQKLSFWNKTPIVQPTTSITGAANVGGSGTTVKVDDTFGGYTLAKVVAALINVGILA